MLIECKLPELPLLHRSVLKENVFCNFKWIIVKLVTKYNLNNMNIDTKLFHKAYLNMKYADLKSNLLLFSVHLSVLV